MLIGRTVDEWEKSYKSAVKVLKDMPLKLEKLSNIHNRPQYYAEYYCRNTWKSWNQRKCFRRSKSLFHSEPLW